MESNVTPATYNAGPLSYGPPPSPTITVGDWLLTYLILAVPVVGFIMLFVWAFGDSTPPSKANWAKSALIVYAVLAGLGLLFADTFLAVFMNIARHNPSY